MFLFPFSQKGSFCALFPKKRMNVGIVGSRTFDDYELLKRTMLSEYGESEGSVDEIKSVIYRIVSGGAEGADTLAKKFAEEAGIELVEKLPDWKKYGHRAGAVRNQLIVNECDEIVAFLSPPPYESKGTKITIEMAKKAGVPVTIVFGKK